MAATLPAVARAQSAEPTAQAVRVSEPPVIDGRLSESVWESADAIGGFRQRDPDEGEPATEASSVRILYDEARLYIGAMLQDREPGNILATELRRDSDFDADDTFSVLLDTFHDHRNAFLFRVNPNGTRFDAVIRNESRIDRDWDEQWTAAAAVGPDGWSVEIAIPFKTLRFNPDQAQLWGIDFERIIKRKNEETYWTNWNRDFDFRHVSQAGHLAGLEDIEQGNRIRVRPYAVAGRESLGAVTPRRSPRSLGDVGIDDVKISVTSNLTADIAINPDFAQTEIDDQRVNLTRFSLFFPEKRQFFVEGAESLRMGPPASNPFAGQGQLELFHSRRIGLSDRGEQISLIAGGKLTGKVRGVDVGMLAARTASHGGQPGETFGVARFRRELLGRSYVGAIATTRGVEGRANTTFGADARFVLWRYLTVAGMAARVDDGSGRPQWARQAGMTWDKDLIQARVVHLGIDPRFNPGVGFVRRRDRRTEASFSFAPRPSGGPVRQFEFSPELVVHHNHGGTLVTRELSFGTEVSFQSGDEINVSAQKTYENLFEPFRIGSGVVLSGGRYEWNSGQMMFRSFDGRRVSPNVRMEWGGFYSGRRRSIQLSSDYRPGRHLTLEPEYEFNDIDLPEGAFRTHLFGLRSDVAFSRDLLTSVFFQYNSDGELAATQVRLNYIFRDIDNFYIVFNDTHFTAGPLSGRSNRSLVAKITYSLHL